LIKACKILLHKINFQTKRTKYEHEQSEIRHQEQYHRSETIVNSQLEEAKHFVNNVHQDFEKFLIKHRQEHQDMNLKTMKLSELAGKTFDNIDLVRDSVEKFATIIACLIEFSSIQQCISTNENFVSSLSTPTQENY
jgi:hypothetical protein